LFAPRQHDARVQRSIAEIDFAGDAEIGIAAFDPWLW
jgi:hypothetical protein